jgi:hypothetical protein
MGRAYLAIIPRRFVDSAVRSKAQIMPTLVVVLVNDRCSHASGYFIACFNRCMGRVWTGILGRASRTWAGWATAFGQEFKSFTAVDAH